MKTNDIHRLIPDHRTLLQRGEELFHRYLKERDQESPRGLDSLIPDCRTLGSPLEPVADLDPRALADLIPNYRTILRRDVVREEEYTATLEEIEPYLDLRKRD